MNKIKIKVSFRYDAEVITDMDDDIDLDSLPDSSEEVKQEVLKSLNFDFCVDKDGAGTISDWKVEIEEIPE